MLLTNTESMKLFKSCQLYRIISGDFTAEEWSTHVHNLLKLDKNNHFCRKIIIFSWLLLVISTGLYWWYGDPSLFFSNSQNSSHTFLNIMIATTKVYSCFMIIGLFVFRNLPAKIEDLLFPLIAILRLDVEPNSTINLWIDCRSMKQRRRLISVNPVSTTRRLKRYDSYYSDRWFYGQVKFKDDNCISWVVENTIRESKITKKNYRGKTKYKSKSKIMQRIDCSLSFKKNIYQYINKDLSIHQKEKDQRSVLKHRQVQEMFVSDHIFDMNDLLFEISLLYRNLKPIG